MGSSGMLLLVACAVAGGVTASTDADQAAYDAKMKGLTLKRVVVLSHHGVPIPNYNTFPLNKYAGYPSPNADETDGNKLSDAGREVAKMIGDYYRQEYMDCRGLVKASECQTAVEEVKIYAKDSSNPKETAAQTMLGLLPDCGLWDNYKVNVAYEPKDLSKRTSERETTHALAMGPRKAASVSDVDAAVKAVSSVIDCCETPKEKEFVCGTDGTKLADGCALNDVDKKWIGSADSSCKFGDVCWTFASGLQVADAFTEVFLREGLNAGKIPSENTFKIANGKLTLVEAVAFSALSEEYKKEFFNSENLRRLGWFFPFKLAEQLSLSVPASSSATATSRRRLSADAPKKEQKMTFLFGNELQMRALMYAFSGHIESPGWLKDQTPFGGALVAEVYEDADKSPWVKLVFVAPSPTQMAWKDLTIEPTQSDFTTAAELETTLKNVLGNPTTLPAILKDAADDAVSTNSDSKADPACAATAAGRRRLSSTASKIKLARSAVAIPTCTGQVGGGRLCPAKSLLDGLVQVLQRFSLSEDAKKVLQPYGYTDLPKKEAATHKTAHGHGHGHAAHGHGHGHSSGMSDEEWRQIVYLTVGGFFLTWFIHRLIFTIIPFYYKWFNEEGEEEESEKGKEFLRNQREQDSSITGTGEESYQGGPAQSW